MEISSRVKDSSGNTNYLLVKANGTKINVIVKPNGRWASARYTETRGAISARDTVAVMKELTK